MERKGDNGFLNQVKISRKVSDKWFYSHVNKPKVGARFILKVDIHL